RPLARARPARLQGANAGDPEPFLFLVRHAEHPLLHHRRFHRPGGRNRRDHRPERRARPPRRPAATRLAELGVEPARRTGRVPAASQAPGAAGLTAPRRGPLFARQTEAPRCRSIPPYKTSFPTPRRGGATCTPTPRF